MKRKANWKRFILTLGIMLLVSLSIGMSTEAASKSKTVATIGKKKYTSLQKAIKKVKNGQTIKLKKNIKNYKSNLVVENGKKFTINLNKKTISFTRGKDKKNKPEDKTLILKNKSKVTIKNGTIAHSKEAGDIIGIHPGSKLTITSGTYNGRIVNNGTLIIKKGTFNGLAKKQYTSQTESLAAIINNTGALTIEGGTFSSKKNFVIFNHISGDSKSTVVITGGTFTSGAKVSNLDSPYEDDALLLNLGKSMTINGGKFTSDICAVENGGGATLNIKQGSFTSNKASAILALPGKITISGGTMTSKGKDEATLLCGTDAIVTIKGGKLNSAGAVIEGRWTSTVTMNDGSLSTSSKSAPVIKAFDDSQIKIKGGSVTGKNTYRFYRERGSDATATVKFYSGANVNTKYGEKLEP